MQLPDWVCVQLACGCCWTTPFDYFRMPNGHVCWIGFDYFGWDIRCAKSERKIFADYCGSRKRRVFIEAWSDMEPIMAQAVLYELWSRRTRLQCILGDWAVLPRWSEVTLLLWRLLCTLLRR